jgi:hypothetical protein
MNNDGLQLIKRTIAVLESKRVYNPSVVKPVAPCHLTQSLAGGPQESPSEITKLQGALVFLSPDTERGHGSFFDASGRPESAIWLAGVWAIASLGWVSGKDIAKNWSQQCPSRYTEKGFEDAWNGYKPNHPNPVGIGSLYKYAMQFGWQTQTIQSAQGTSSKYKLLTGLDIRSLPPVQWRLKGILPYEGLASIYGPSTSGKSFLAFDIAVAIAEGNDWFGCRTTKSTVVYVALEGESGFKNRVAAWELENGQLLPPNMLMVMQPFQITNPFDVEELVAVLPHGAVVIVDTLNRTAPTSDENSSMEMGEILQACKQLQALINGLIILVHHTGKDNTRGARGHSSFFAALDGAIEVERKGTERKWSVAKAKDGQDGKSSPFDLKRHVLGVDSDGDEISSCTIEAALGSLFAKPKPKGKKQKTALEDIENHFATSPNPTIGIKGSPTGSSCLKFEDVVTYLTGTLSTTQQNKRSNEARRLLTALAQGGFIGTTIDVNGESWCWVV